MGIRFACHHCNASLHLKDFQAGKRGKCPACKNVFRIPMHSAEYSLPIDESASSVGSDSLDQPLQGTRSVSGGLRTRTADSSTAIATPQSFPSPKTTPKTTSPASTSDTKQGVAPKSSSLPPTVTPTKRAVSAFEAVPKAQWYVRPPSGGQYGPADSSLLTQWCEENRVTEDSLIWREGLSQWALASQLLPELFQKKEAAESPTSGGPPHLPPTFPPSSPSNPSLVSGPHQRNDSLAQPIALSNRPVQKRSQRNRKHWVQISVLAGICVCLFVALILVLFLQK